MTRADILTFMRTHSLGVQASVSPEGVPQAAVVGFVVTDDFEIVFDTLARTRKALNLRRNAACTFVIGGLTHGDERTVQYEGIADEPMGTELERLKAMYFVRFPDGLERSHWPGLIYVRIRRSVFCHRPRGHGDDDRVPGVRIQTQPLCGLPAAHAGPLQIHHDHGREVQDREWNGGHAIGSTDHLDAAQTEVTRQHLEGVGIVIDDQDEWFVVAHPSLV